MDILRLSKKAGCRVGSTSNATLLNESMIEKMVAAGLDVIGFSLAGVNKQNIFQRCWKGKIDEAF